MDYSDAVLGSHAARKLREKNGAPVLRIGRDHFTRADLASAECFNFLAAQTLSSVLTAELKVKDTRDLFDNVAPADLALPRIGVIALAVLGAAFERRGLGGDAPLESWAKKHLARDAHLVAFASIKNTAQPRRARRKKAS